MKKQVLRILLTGSLIATTAFSTHATTFSVTTTGDAGAGSLRQAVTDANSNAGADTIDFSGLTFPATINLTTGEIIINDDVMITGPGATQLAVSGTGNSRCFNISSGKNAVMSGITIQNGGNVFAGGGIYSDGNLTAKNCRFTASYSMGYGAAIGGYAGTLTLDSCLIDSNTADGPGAVFVGNGQLNISYCTFMNNISNQSRGGAIYVNTSSLNIYGSTFSGNIAWNGNGGAIGGQESSINITNATFSGNTSNPGGAALTLIDYGAGTSSLTLMNVTVASSTGSAIFLENGGGIPVFTTTNSIFSNAANYSSAGTVTQNSNGYNISSDATMSAILTSSGDMNNTDPLLQPLANNGGPTLTHAISCSSPAVNAGTNALAPATDQRGILRVGNTDIGAYESTLTPAAPYSVSATICQGASYTVGTSTYTASGTYQDTLVAASTCDSIIITTLTVLSTTSSTEMTTACDSYNWNGNSYTATGTYVDTIPNAAGCDSIMTLNLTINTVDASVTSSNETITANVSGAVYQWLDCNNSFAPVANETNQSFNATVNGDYAVEVTENGCTDTSSCTLITTVSVQELSQSLAISIFPNPANDVLNVTVETPSSGQSLLTITNAAGQFVYSEFVKLATGKNTLRCNVKEFARGIYFIKVTTHDSVYTRRVVVQ
jgi:predicted outer membrane repeat protein